jgi:heat shock protein HtpX
MDLGLFDHIDRNRRRSVVLIVAAIVLLAGMGALLGAALEFSPWAGLGVAAAVGGALSVTAWHEGSAIVLGAAGAEEVPKEADPELVNVVEEVAIAAGLPRPRVYLIPDDSMNAFAAGMRPEKAVVAVTRGLRRSLRRDELQGVVAHEMAHIGNRDTRVMVLMAVLVGSVAILSDYFLRSLRFGGGRRRGGGKGQGVVLLLAILLAIVAPLLAALIRFAVSRRREYLADATGAALTRNPGALADALEKLGGQGPRAAFANRGTQHLFIVNPFRARQAADTVFATHPPLDERIRRLRRLAGQYATT